MNEVEPELSPEEIERRRLELIDDLKSRRMGFESPAQNQVKRMLEIAEWQAWPVYRMKWTILRPPPDRPFVIADNPAASYDPAPANPDGGSALISSPRSETFFPLGRGLGIVASVTHELWRDVTRAGPSSLKLKPEAMMEKLPTNPGEWALGEASDEYVDSLNLRQYAHALRWLYGPSQQTVQDLHRLAKARRQEVATYRPARKQVTVLEDAGTGDGRLVATERLLLRPLDERDRMRE